MNIFLIRHAHAGHRDGSSGDDLSRPLTKTGELQARAITAALTATKIEVVMSSEAIRCVETVRPLAQARGLEVEVNPALTEGARSTATTNLIWSLASEGRGAVLCSHGDVIPSALDALRHDGVAVDNRSGLPKGTYYELTVLAGSITTARMVDPRPS